MDRRWIALVSLALASCCCRPCGPCAGPGGPDGGAAHEAPRVVDFAPSPMGVQPPDLPPPRNPQEVARPPVPPGFNDEIRRIQTLADAGEQQRALAALHAESPDGFAVANHTALAAVAPTVLRVYDLSAVLADGGDYPEELLPLARSEEAMKSPPRPVGPAGRLERIKDDLVREASLAGWPRDSTFVEATAPWIVVLHPLGMLGQIERILDRVATTGGRVVRLHVDVLHDAAALAERLGVSTSREGDWRVKALAREAVPSEEEIAPLRLASFAFDAATGRWIGARRTATTAYVKDFDVEQSMGGAQLADPVVSEIRDGIAATAMPDGASLWVDFHVATLVRPIPTYTMIAGEETATVETPTIEVLHFFDRLVITPGAATYMLEPKVDGTSALFRIEPAPGPVAPETPGWRRVLGGGAPPAEPPRVVTVEVRAVDAAGKTLTAPRVSAAVGQRATVQVMDRTSYIRDFDLERAKAPSPAGVAGAGTIANPVIGTVAEGLAIDFSALPGEGAGRTFDVRVAASTLERPIRTFDLVLGSSPVKIQLPASHDVVTPHRVVLAPGQEASLGTVTVGTREGPKDVTVSIRYVSEEAVR